jgi:hypothetical protein
MIRVLVTGGRNYANRGLVYEVLDDLHRHQGISTIIHGGATGADEHADGWARSRLVAVQRYPVTRQEWQSVGNRAGPMRNQRMLDEGKPTAVVAFPGGRGTADMVRRARDACIMVYEVER